MYRFTLFIISEFVLFGLQVVYIAPLKALVKERIRDWKVRFQKKLKKEVVELTGWICFSLFRFVVLESF